MIINIRGPGGAGKSTLVRRVMELGNKVFTAHEDGRKQPLGYLYQFNSTSAALPVRVAIPGHYESRCGGCDTIPEYDKLYSLVAKSSISNHVLYEGLLISEDVPRTLGLCETVAPTQIHVIALDTPLELCLDSINLRRESVFQERLQKAQDENLARSARGLKPRPLPESRGPVDTKKTTDKWKGLRRSMKKIERVRTEAHANLTLHWRDRDGAYQLIRELLSI